MLNRKNLHDYGLVLILLSVLNLFTFVGTIVAGFVDGSIPEALAGVEADILIAVKVMLGVFGAIMGLFIFADAFIGFKALRVSENPTADKWYINLGKVFCVLSFIATVFAIRSFFDSNASIVDSILIFVNAGLDTVIYFLFVKAANAVRNDVLNATR